MTTNPHATAQIAGHPVHPMVIAFPIACFVLTLVSDLAFYRTSNEFWAKSSLWLLGIGLITAALAAVTGLIDISGDDRIRKLSDARLHAAGNAVAMLIALYSWYERYQHGSSAILPTGVVLSAVVVFVLVFTGWKGGEMVFRHRVGVADTHGAQIDPARLDSTRGKINPMTSELKYGPGGQLDDGKPRLSEDDIQRKELGPRGVLGRPDPAKMTPQRQKKTPKNVDPGHTA
jgi:uncharacterized membrane protein